MIRLFMFSIVCRWSCVLYLWLDCICFNWCFECNFTFRWRRIAINFGLPLVAPVTWIAAWKPIVSYSEWCYLNVINLYPLCRLICAVSESEDSISNRTVQEIKWSCPALLLTSPTVTNSERPHTSTSSPTWSRRIQICKSLIIFRSLIAEYCGM